MKHKLTRVLTLELIIVAGEYIIQLQRTGEPLVCSIMSYNLLIYFIGINTSLILKTVGLTFFLLTEFLLFYVILNNHIQKKTQLIFY